MATKFIHNQQIRFTDDQMKLIDEALRQYQIENEVLITKAEFLRQQVMIMVLSLVGIVNIPKLFNKEEK